MVFKHQYLERRHTTVVAVAEQIPLHQPQGHLVV
jgi:hypothetical protein